MSLLNVIIATFLLLKFNCCLVWAVEVIPEYTKDLPSANSLEKPEEMLGAGYRYEEAPEPSKFNLRDGFPGWANPREVNRPWDSPENIYRQEKQFKYQQARGTQQSAENITQVIARRLEKKFKRYPAKVYISILSYGSTGDTSIDMTYIKSVRYRVVLRGQEIFAEVYRQSFSGTFKKAFFTPKNEKQIAVIISKKIEAMLKSVDAL